MGNIGSQIRERLANREIKRKKKKSKKKRKKKKNIKFLPNGKTHRETTQQCEEAGIKCGDEKTDKIVIGAENRYPEDSKEKKKFIDKSAGKEKQPWMKKYESEVDGGEYVELCDLKTTSDHICLTEKDMDEERRPVTRKVGKKTYDGNLGTSTKKLNPLFSSSEASKRRELRELKPGQSLGKYIANRLDLPFSTQTPMGIATSANGDIFVADYDQRRIHVVNDMTKNHSFWESIGGKCQPVDVAVTPDNLVIISDREERQCLVCNDIGQVLCRIGQKELIGPLGVAVSHNGIAHVVDNIGHCVRTYDVNGKLLKTVGSEGCERGNLFFPWYTATDGDTGDILVTDFLNNRIQKFNSESGGCQHFGPPPPPSGELSSSSTLALKGIDTDRHGNCYVCDELNDRILVFDRDSGYRGSIRTKGMRKPLGIAVSKEESHTTIFVTSSEENCIYKLSMV